MNCQRIGKIRIRILKEQPAGLHFHTVVDLRRIQNFKRGKNISIFRLGVSSVMALFSLIREKIAVNKTLVETYFFSEIDVRKRIHIFRFRFYWVCIVLERKPRRLYARLLWWTWSPPYSSKSDSEAYVFVFIRSLKATYYSNFKRPFKYLCILMFTRFFFYFKKRLLCAGILSLGA